MYQKSRISWAVDILCALNGINTNFQNTDTTTSEEEFHRRPVFIHGQKHLLTLLAFYTRKYNCNVLIKHFIKEVCIIRKYKFCKKYALFVGSSENDSILFPVRVDIENKTISFVTQRYKSEIQTVVLSFKQLI